MPILAEEKKDKEKTIIWLGHPFPPIIIADGPNKGKGTSELMRNLLISNMKEYTHVLEYPSMARMEQIFKSPDSHACAIAVLKTPEREQYLYFAKIPSTAVTGHVIYFNETGLAKLKKDPAFAGVDFSKSPSLSLSKVLHVKGLKGVAKRKRSYSAVLDKILSETGSNVDMVESPSSESEYNMVTRGFADFFLEYQSSRYYAEATQKQDSASQRTNQKTYAFLLDEVTAIKIYSYAVCAKNEWGKRTMADIEAKLMITVPQDAWFEALNYWSPKDNLKSSRKFFDQFIHEFYGK